jgi:hypothetical protein
MMIFALVSTALLFAAAARWGTDSRDGRDWTPQKVPPSMR